MNTLLISLINWRKNAFSRIIIYAASSCPFQAKKNNELVDVGMNFIFYCNILWHNQEAFIRFHLQIVDKYSFHWNKCKWNRFIQFNDKKNLFENFPKCFLLCSWKLARKINCFSHFSQIKYNTLFYFVFFKNNFNINFCYFCSFLTLHVFYLLNY